MSKQYEPNPAYCGWLLEEARCCYLACSGSAVSHKGCSILFLYNKSSLNEACLLNMAGCCPRSFLV